MCRRKRKESDRKKSVFGLGTKIFIGFIAAFVLYWFISAIDAAIRIKEAGGLIEEKSFIGILMYILDIAFPVKTLVIGLVFGFVWYMYSKRRKDINEAKEAAEAEIVTEETAAEQEEIIDPVQYKEQ